MKNRVVWFLWLVCMAAGAVITGEYLFVCVLAATAVLLVVSCIYGVFSGRKVQTRFILPERSEQESVFQVKMGLENQSFYPVFRGNGSIHWENLLTGENGDKELELSLRGKKEELVAFQGRSNSCGCIRFQFADWKVRDLFGIVAFKRRAGISRDMVVMPHKSRMDLALLSREGFDMESFKFSKNRPGDDPGETYDVREYRPGDSIRQIHWKLSGKLDEVMIREKSYPVDEAVLILAEPGQEGERSEAPEAVAEIYGAVLYSFMEQRIPCQTAVYDPASGQLRLEKVDTLRDYEDIMYRFLCHSNVNEKPAVIRDYLKNPGQKSFAAYIYITGDSEDQENELLPREAQIVTVRRGKNAAHNGNELIYTDGDYRRELGIRKADRRADYGTMDNREKKEKV